MSKELLICGLLLLAVVGVFGQTLRHDFVNYDDNKYVLNNPHMSEGLTTANVAWAFTSRDASNWHPLTWLSHLIDCQLFGKTARGHHLTNVLLHATAVVVLFLVLCRMTGDLWPSAFVAAVFAIHPLRVESVAWIAERKDVLSGLFFMLTLAAYLGYVRRPFSPARYLSVAVLFAFGLMAKPMLVTLPFVLLLLDYWPLERFLCKAMPSPCRRELNNLARSTKSLIIEKIPLMVLSAASCAATLWAQAEAIAASEHITLSARLGNAAVSYIAYVRQFFFPTDLAVLYPHPGNDLATWKIAAAVMALAAITGCAVALRRRAPFLLVGWLWYVGMLLPVIGLVQVGQQAMADRYTYLPQIGLGIAVAWSAAQVAKSSVSRGWACGAAATIVLVVLAACAAKQTSYWRNSETLWTRAIACTERNQMAHYNFGVALAAGGRIDEAIEQYEKAIDVKPDYAEALYNLGVLLNRRGQVDEAMEQYRKVLALVPDSSEAHLNLGVAMAARGLDDEAIWHYREALRIMPKSADAHNNLANVLRRRGQVGKALANYEKAVQIDPNYAAAHYNMAKLLADEGRLAEAIDHFRRVLAIEPGREDARRDLELVLERLGKTP